MSVSVTLEAMLAILNKEHVAPIASPNPYDARSTPWLKRPSVMVAVLEYGAYGLRMFTWQAHEAQSRIRDWRVIGTWKQDLNTDMTQNTCMHQYIIPFGKGNLNFLVVRYQWSLTCFAGCCAAIDTLRPRKLFNPWPKREKWRFL